MPRTHADTVLMSDLGMSKVLTLQGVQSNAGRQMAPSRRRQRRKRWKPMRVVPRVGSEEQLDQSFHALNTWVLVWGFGSVMKSLVNCLCCGRRPTCCVQYPFIAVIVNFFVSNVSEGFPFNVQKCRRLSMWAQLAWLSRPCCLLSMPSLPPLLSALLSVFATIGRFSMSAFRFGFHLAFPLVMLQPRLVPGAVPAGSFDNSLCHPTVKPLRSRRFVAKSKGRDMMPEVNMETRLVQPPSRANRPDRWDSDA